MSAHGKSSPPEDELQQPTESNHDYGMMSVIRSAIFLASLMMILEHHYVLEWLDVFMLRIVAAVAPNTTREGPIEALTFTIQEELFEKEFYSRSPIDRTVLLKYLQKLDDVYFTSNSAKTAKFRNLKVLAIDYDLSPNNFNWSHYERRHECIINDSSEQKSQDFLDKFFLKLIKKGVKVVLIKHISVRNTALCECKIKWEQEKYKQGILFGHADLLHHGSFGPVIKYVESEDSFPAIVLAAANDSKLPIIRFTCDDPEQSSGNDLSHASFHLINYLQAHAKGAVKVCQLKDVNGFDDCKRYYFSENVASENTDKIKVIFFGGDYGKDDTYITPLDTQPGVVIQAYTYFSKSQHGQWTWLRVWGAWLGDIILGSGIGLIFHLIWEKFHDYRKCHRFAPQVELASLNFIILIVILAFLVFLVAPLLALGVWINPAPIIIGLFIHSYMAAATTGEGKVHGVSSSLATLFGIPSQQVLKGERHDLIFYLILKIAVFWSVLGLAVYLLVTHH